MLTLHQVSIRTGKSIFQLKRMIKNGNLEVVRIGCSDMISFDACKKIERELPNHTITKIVNKMPTNPEEYENGKDEYKSQYSSNPFKRGD